MHPQTFDILHMEESLCQLQLFESDDPLIAGFDHHLNPYFKANHAFSLFPRLPPELRLMIWAAAADERQIVRIIPCSEDGSGEEGFQADYTMPVILQVCRDSRNEALKKYAVIFGGILRDPIYFNYQRDFICLVGTSTYEHFEVLSQEDNFVSGEIQKIENVLSMAAGLGSGKSEEDVLLEELATWDGIKNIIIVERSATWWSTFKEIWSDKEMKALTRDAKANHTRVERQSFITPSIPEVRIVKFDDVLDAIEEGERKSLDSSYAMLRFFDSLFDTRSTYNIKRSPRKPIDSA
ncbi:hypothetical protein DSL72_001320 [Monilinia vaccinii-corymbosi]|uniref:2EXR domain-containing protein n=1 Tax=Monilinia vaccinii-corymbosi TaxID=61207 RepID=A0A8A3P3M4_9HELO|nr:hypothetical protein DSL72_001320 [Monilinia vaccinii-corymbosi]